MTGAPATDTSVTPPRNDAGCECGASVVEVFAARVAERPHAVAVRFDGRALTYAQLDARSNQLARVLQAGGVAHEVLVGVFMERSLELVVALLGVLKAGGAYVPLDVDYPPARLRLMLDDTRARVIVTQSDLADRLPSSDVQRLMLEPELDSLAGQPEDPLACPAGPASLAYVMYTSGSTGTPKGVEIVHRGIVRLVRGQPSVPLGPDETILHASALTFDISTFEVWGALLNGGRLAVHPPGPPRPDAIVRTIRQHSVTTANLATPIFHLVVDFDPAGLSGLRQLLAGGDVLSVAHARRLLRELPDCRLVNAFGPTEATTFACTHVVSPELGADTPSVPIGRPIAGARAEVLGPDGHPAMPGEEGELYLGGDGLARAYHRRPELTAERFVPDPQRPGERLYRTGDRVRLRTDGELEFCGRVDEQAKIRGVRVEPGEVEAALRQHPAVAEAAVIARPAPGGHRRLAAYVVRRPNTGGTGPELRSFTADRLPAPLVPSDFVELDVMPLTPNGKLDRAALAARDDRHPRHDPAPPDRELSYERGASVVEVSAARVAERPHAPLTGTQTRLATIWARLLDIEAPGPEADFFELGGDSLLAVGLVARVADEFGVELSLADVFEASQLAELAAQIDAMPATARPLPPIVPAARGGEMLLAPSQEGLWFTERLAPLPPAHRFCALVHLEGEIDVDALRRALSALVERHEVLRTSFRERNGSAVQVIHAPAPVELATVDCSQVDEKRQPALLRELLYDVLAEIRLDCPALVRWRLVRLSPRRHALAHAQHHLIHDGWSWRVLVGELAELYSAFVEGRAPRLPAPELQFADFAVWQRDVIEPRLASDQLAWWRRKLTPPPAALPLPLDHPRPPHPTYAGAALREQLPASLCARIAALSREEQTTTFTVMLTAFFALLHRHSGGAEDVCVGVPVANRRRPESERLLGLLANVVPLRVSLAGAPSGRELLGRIHDEALAAHDHQDVPYTQVIETVRPPREHGHAMLARTFFSLVGVPDEPEMPGLRVRVDEGLNDRSTVADLVVSVHERGGRSTGRGNRTGSGNGAKLVWAYSTDVFEPATARRLLADYRAILGALLSDPDRRLSQLSGLLASPAGDGRTPTAPQAQMRAPRRLDDRRALVAPKDTVEAQLTRLWEELLGVRPIGVEDDFFELGGHSLLALHLFAQIREVFDRDLPLASLFDGPTIAHLARLLSQPASVHGISSSLVAIQPRGSKRPFFCVHEFFGDVLLYRNLARRLGEDQPFYALQARRPDDAEQPFARIEDMAAHYVDAVQTVQAEGPYLLGGLCSGGVVAYEMAQVLRAQGHAPGLVALLDAPAVKSAKLQRSIRNVAQGVPDWARGLGELTDDQRRELIRLKIAMAKGRLKGRVADVARSFRSTDRHQQPNAPHGHPAFKEVADLLQFSEHHRKVAEAQSQAIRAYVPRMYPGSVTLFRARSQPLFRPRAPDMGWHTLALGGAEVRVVPGNHSGMLQEPHVRALAQELSACLDRWQPEYPSAS